MLPQEILDANLFTPSSDGHVHEFWWLPNGQPWQTSHVSAQAGGQGLAPEGGLTSWLMGNVQFLVL
ncbi:MAG: hypothetical protein WBZ36_11460 [Candidatus Nitrosopolaris sp.]